VEEAATTLSLCSHCNTEAWDGSKAKLLLDTWDLETLQALRKNGKPPCPTIKKGGLLQKWEILPFHQMDR